MIHTGAPMVQTGAPMMARLPPQLQGRTMGCVGCAGKQIEGVTFGADAGLTSTPWYQTTIFKVLLGITVVSLFGYGIWRAARS